MSTSLFQVVDLNRTSNVTEYSVFVVNDFKISYLYSITQYSEANIGFIYHQSFSEAAPLNQEALSNFPLCRYAA